MFYIFQKISKAANKIISKCSIQKISELETFAQDREVQKREKIISAYFAALTVFIVFTHNVDYQAIQNGTNLSTTSYQIGPILFVQKPDVISTLYNYLRFALYIVFYSILLKTNFRSGYLVS